MKETDDTMDFLLPELLGKPDGLSDKKGNMIFPENTEIPPDCFIFFIPIEKWKKVNQAE